MFDFKKISFLTLFILISFMIFSMIGSVSAADYSVNSWTTQNDINNWMKSNTTVSGDSLVFDEAKYHLPDTLVINKPINIKSNKNTQIIFNKAKTMFYINSSGVNFSGLILNHDASGKDKDSRISTMEFSGSKTVNIKDITFNLNGNYLSATSFGDWIGNVNDIRLCGNGIVNFGFTADNWKGNLHNSILIMNKDNANSIGIVSKWTGNIINTQIHLKGKESIGIMASVWQGNLANVIIDTNQKNSFGIFADKWRGTFSKLNIFADKLGSIGIHSFDSKGTVSNSNISAKNGLAILVSKNVKVINTRAISKKGTDNIYYFGPRLKLGVVLGKQSSKVYNINVHNIGEFVSKAAKLTVSCDKYKKTLRIKPIRAGKFLSVKVVLPAKYATSKYRKHVKVEYRNIFGKKTTSNKSSFKF